MADVVDKRDVTVDLPDEVLCHVFSFLSLEDNFRSESVNFKFQRCVIKELTANPQPFILLNLENHRMYNLNGYEVSEELIFAAVQTLAKKAKLSSIWVHIGFVGEEGRSERMDQLLSLLTSDGQCLTKVTSFESNGGCSQAVLESFLDKCDKLSTIKLDFEVRPLNSPYFLHSFPLDLCQLLNNRQLSHLKLRPFFYPNSDLARVFQAIKPDTLRKLDLSFRETQELNLVELLKALRPIGCVLEEIRLEFYELDVELSGLFESLALLPALRKVDIDCIIFEVAQFVPAVTSLFTLTRINITVADRVSPFFDSPACELVNMIHQIQNVHPGLVVDFDFDDKGTLILILSLGNATIRKSIRDAPHCAAADCVECQSFYPCLLHFLRSRLLSHPEDHHHFPNWQLDRCRVGHIVDHFNAHNHKHYRFKDWRALSVESSDDQQSVTINFESIVNVNEDHHLSSITIGCGQCITNGCMKCLDWVLLL